MARKQIDPVHPGTYLKELLEEVELSQYHKKGSLTKL